MSETLQSSAEQPATDYPAAARVVHLHLSEFCDETLPYPEMIAVAARRAAREIATLRGSLGSRKARRESR